MNSEEITIILYITEGCWLCDWAMELLNGLKGRYNLVIKTVEITGDDRLYEKYRFDIPVAEFPDGSALKGRIKKEELLRKIDGYTE